MENPSLVGCGAGGREGTLCHFEFSRLGVRPAQNY